MFIIFRNNVLRNRASNRKLLCVLFILNIFVAVIAFIQIYSLIENIGTPTNTIDSSSLSTKCKHVSVDELDQWFHSRKSNEIPKIIHQTWKNKTLRKRQTRWSNTWCEQYTDWYYHLWTDDENDMLVRTKFPWFYSIYQQLSPAILKADTVRYLYMLYYGGLYLDLDYESIHRVDELLINKTVVLSLINYDFHRKNNVPNSWMISKPNHPMWTYVLHRIMLLWSRATDKERNEFWNGKAEFFTGPRTLFPGLMFYIHKNQRTHVPLEQLIGDKKKQKSDSILEVGDVTFLGPKLINAYDWMHGIGKSVCSAEQVTFNEEKCKDIVKPIYAITYWSHSYGNGHENDTNYLQN